MTASTRRPAGRSRRLAAGLSWVASLLALAGLALAGVGVAPALAQPYEVPIYHSTVDGKQNFLIYASVGGGPLVPFLFDTGSPAMYSVYGSWWPGHTKLVNQTGNEKIKYASGTVYHYDTVATDVSVGSRGGRVVATAENAAIGRITNVDDQSPRRSFRLWAKNVAAGRAPFTDDGTYGNFGAALHGEASFGTVMTQFPLKKGMKRGFVVMSGGRDAKVGKLVIGLTDQMIAGFRWRLPMAPTGALLPGVGSSDGPPGYQKAQVANTVVRLERRGKHWSGVIPTVFDTGGGNGTWAYGASVPRETFVKDDSNEARAGTSFDLRYVGKSLLAYQSGNAPARDILGFIPASATDLRINPGILMFYTYDVMFDLDDGFIGLRRATALGE
jgi:hypothetical protein